MTCMTVHAVRVAHILCLLTWQAVRQAYQPTSPAERTDRCKKLSCLKMDIDAGHVPGPVTCGPARRRAPACRNVGVDGDVQIWFRLDRDLGHPRPSGSAPWLWLAVARGGWRSLRAQPSASAIRTDGLADDKGTLQGL